VSEFDGENAADGGSGHSIASRLAGGGRNLNAVCGGKVSVFRGRPLR
jgi:hypothetical protein